MSKSTNKLVLRLHAVSRLAIHSIVVIAANGCTGEQAALDPCAPHFAVDIVGSPNFGPDATTGQNRLPEIVLGPPQGLGDENGNIDDVLSLGVGGEIIIELDPTGIVDGPGADIIVFENAFYVSGQQNLPYAELGEISVSNDLMAWQSFTCHAESYPYDGCAGWHPVYSNPNNGVSPFDEAQAGGDTFDLATLGLSQTRYLRIRDLKTSQIGPPSAGFDLDAVAVRYPHCTP